MSAEGTTRDASLRAQIRALVREHGQAIIAECYELVRVLHAGWPNTATEALLSAARRNGLRTAAGWTPGTSSGQRLARLERELLRLHKRAEGRPHEQLGYVRLHRLVWVEISLEWQAKEAALREKLSDLTRETLDRMLSAPLWAGVGQRLLLSPAEHATWQAELRLALAQAVLDTFNALYETRALQQELKPQEGEWQWP
jgi:hypothetical protein